MSWNLHKAHCTTGTAERVEVYSMDHISSAVRLIDRDYFLKHPDDYANVLPALIQHLQELSGFYPSFNKWLYEKVIPGIIVGERSIIVEHQRGVFSGLAILKNNACEQKLCCLRVLPPFQGSGVGLRLFERSFELLNNDRPLLSVAEEQIHVFQRLFKHYGFALEKKYDGYYRPQKYEFSFNGLIDSDSVIPSSPEREVKHDLPQLKYFFK